MKFVELLPVGKVDTDLLRGLKQSLTSLLGVSCEISSRPLDPEPSFHIERQQYHSSEMLQRMQPLAGQRWRLLGITAADLYIPILKYVFGEAQMGGPCALVSYHRLRQEFYGLEADRDLLSARLLKECIHELGHTLDLRHCDNYRCAMASAHAVEWIDLREPRLCEVCFGQVTPALAPPRSRESWF